MWGQCPHTIFCVGAFAPTAPLFRRLCLYIMLQMVKQITAAIAVSISQTNTITTGNSKALSLCCTCSYLWHGCGHDWLCYCNRLCTACLGSFRTFAVFYSTLGYQEKATETICSWNLMVESVAPCLHTDP